MRDMCSQLKDLQINERYVFIIKGSLHLYNGKKIFFCLMYDTMHFDCFALCLIL